jgi:serine/threonine protein kinase
LVVALSGAHHGVLFALKVFLNVHKDERLKRFELEGAFLAETNHPAVMKVYDKGTVRMSDGQRFHQFPFVVADYYPNTLDSAFHGRSRMPARVIYMMQLLSALVHLSSLDVPVVHRDIKPKNIFLRGHACALGDFGLMKRLIAGAPEVADGQDVLVASTGPGMPRHYRTPDLVAYAREGVALSTKSDIFQLGLVGAEMFCLRNPLKRVDDLLSPIELEPLAPISSSLASMILDVLGRMLALNPVDRPEPRELLEQWEAVLQRAVSTYHELEGTVF